MSYQIVFFDIDGTILKKDGSIDDSTRHALSSLKQQGIEVVLATGRNNKKTIEVANQIGVDSYISYNGSYVVYKGKEVYKNTLSPARVSAFLTAVENNEGAAACFSLQDDYYTDIHHPVLQIANDVHLSNEPLQSIDRNEITDVFGMALYAHSIQEVNTYKEQFPDLSFVHWNTLHHCCDVLPINGSKATGIERLLRYLHIPKEQAIAFGDGENDQEMLAYVGLGIAMGNAAPSLLPFADRQTTSVEEDGVYQALHSLGLIETC